MVKIQMGFAVSLSAFILVAACAGEAASDSAAPAEVMPRQELPAGHPTIPQDNSSVIPTPPPKSGEGAQGLNWTRPARWVEETPSSKMRRAQYRVRGENGDAQCVVFYFGPGQGGEAKANVERWADQFGQPGGGSSRDAMTTEALVVGGLPVLVAEVKGIYSGGMTGMGQQTPRPDSMLLGAVAEGPDANWFFKLTGPEQTVEENREPFMTMVRSIRAGE